MKLANITIAVALLVCTGALAGGQASGLTAPDWQGLRNPVWAVPESLRDPSVLRTETGYQVYYSRISSAGAGNPKNWAIACATTSDFRSYRDDHDVSAKGFASPGDVVFWHGRWVLPFQSYT